MGNVSRKIATKSKRKYEKTHRSTNKRCKRFYTFAHFLRSDNAHGNVAIPLINRPIIGDLNVQLCRKKRGSRKIINNIGGNPPESFYNQEIIEQNDKKIIEQDDELLKLVLKKAFDLSIENLNGNRDLYSGEYKNENICFLGWKKKYSNKKKKDYYVNSHKSQWNIPNLNEINTKLLKETIITTTFGIYNNIKNNMNSNDHNIKTYTRNEYNMNDNISTENWPNDYEKFKNIILNNLTDIDTKISDFLDEKCKLPK